MEIYFQQGNRRKTNELNFIKIRSFFWSLHSFMVKFAFVEGGFSTQNCPVVKTTKENCFFLIGSLDKYLLIWDVWGAVTIALITIQLKTPK